MSVSGFLATVAPPLLASVASLLAKRALDYLPNGFFLFGTRNLKVTLPGGKSEYLLRRQSSPEALSNALAEYLAYEAVVQAALRQAGPVNTDVRDIPDKADFKVSVAGKTFLVEAKTHPEAVTGRELRALLVAEPADGLVLVTPEALATSRRERILAESGGIVRFVSGKDIATLEGQLAASFQYL
ncbi:hypothetical protein [Sphingomonas phyllosphaerae]|uniref:hypothetical protein n=1 Tax=Sphingomonas phyllosphaerae TaxID=257003 RepID=UPI0012DC72D7|nr:hypothetical protein [Sphingomonas phyllosphaerae]